MLAGTEQVREELVDLRRGLHIAMDEMARRDNQNRAREILLGIDARMLAMIRALQILPRPSGKTFRGRTWP
jgi:hypothetical protein